MLHVYVTKYVQVSDDTIASSRPAAAPAQAVTATGPAAPRSSPRAAISVPFSGGPWRLQHGGRTR